MKNYDYPKTADWKNLCLRPKKDQKQLFNLCQTIFYEIIKEGDKALKKYSQQFDQILLEEIEVVVNSENSKISKELQQAINLAISNISAFHKSQKEAINIIENTKGVKCWRETRAIEKVGIYIPGGSAPLFSTVLMLAIPAKIAGCKEIILCTPPDKSGNINPAVLYAAQLVGVTKIFALGGIQAIAAMGIGTKTIPKVDKIFGPGNQYVTAAKQYAQYQGTAIDMPAGPSEVLVVADHEAQPDFIAADLLSQAEHGPDSQVILLSNSSTIINKVQQEIQNQLEKLPRKEIAQEALENSKSILLSSIDECINFSNIYAPEHLILAIDNPKNYINQIQNAGSVFLGKYSCESAGDYASGTNHTLPTNAYAKSYSGVSLDSFVKKITIQRISEKGIQNLGKTIEKMAAEEGLFAHKNAVTLRLKNLENGI